MHSAAVISRCTGEISDKTHAEPQNAARAMSAKHPSPYKPHMKHQKPGTAISVGLKRHAGCTKDTHCQREMCCHCCIQKAEEAHLDIEQDHGMIQQIRHLRSGPLLTLLPFQCLTKLPSFFPDFAAQQPLIICQLGSPRGLTTCKHHVSLFPNPF